MTRVLLRSHKDPFTVLPPEVTLARNTIGTNSGNLIFSQAAHRMLSTKGAEVTATNRLEPADAERINDEFDVFVVPLANAFRVSFRKQLVKLTRLIERLRIPVVVLGVGAQGSLDYDAGNLEPIEAEVKGFVKAVLDRSASIGVRGDFTRDYLSKLGFKDIEVIGCPSMFTHGGELSIKKEQARLTPDARIAINISPYVEQMGEIVTRHQRAYPQLTYIAQDIGTLELLLWGEHTEAARYIPELPVHASHPLYRENRVRLFADPQPWFEYLAACDFSFGTRIHGNIAALISGTPCYVLAHDSRTLELAEYFDIPHLKLREDVSGIDAARLYEEADFSLLMSRHKERFTRLVEFMERNGLDHVFRDGEDGGQAFDERLRATNYPPGIETLAGATNEDLISRLAWIRREHTGVKQEHAKLQREHATVRQDCDALRKDHDQLRRAHDKLSQQVDRLAKQLAKTRHRHPLRALAKRLLRPLLRRSRV